MALVQSAELGLARVLEGKSLAKSIIMAIREEYIALNTTAIPRLDIIKANTQIDSAIYVRRKCKVLEDLGFICNVHEPTNSRDFFELAKTLNENDQVHGILIQHPVKLENSINPAKVYSMIKPWKDVDALNPVNIGLLATMDSNPYFIPCTPKAVIALLQFYGIPISGKKVCIIGRSAIVGMPLFHLLQRHNATVTVCHSKTEDLPSYLKEADIVVAAIGKPNFIREDWIKPGATVIDVGINELESGENRRICGDVDFEQVKHVAGAISPVPGGVGPLTVAMLARNVFEAFKLTRIV